ncbi:MAG: response regulator transcription factor [Candidatus Marinimicrobia bacterium]|nr:response regulator transcription factor [Candidatus Neomarinimicrobiota bacterium]
MSIKSISDKKHQKIIIIDDDVDLAQLLEEFLTAFNFKVELFHSPKKGIEFLKNSEADLIVLDIMMPEMDGFQTLRKIREFSAIPVVMLTARGEVTDRIVGLELGADDYMPKPFEPRELLARIQSILRRSQSPSQLLDVIEFEEGLSLNKLKQEVSISGEPIHLSTTEYEVLLLFVEHPGEVLDREFLVENIRGIKWQSYDRSVDVLVSRLRSKIGENPSENTYIKTIHGTGYKFIGAPKN